MNLKSVSECEDRRIQKFINFKLPNYYKKIGWIGFILSFVILIATKFFEGDYSILVEILKRLLLVFLLIVVMSKEKLEDEMIKSIRSQAFSFAFVGAVAYTLLQPVINIIVASIVKPEKAIFNDLGDFQILWFMMIIYLVVFMKLKKRA
ncbi:MAG: hypothetical protein COB12_09000 [Flavobacterium sp.]|nr:MAG: hypothetical protein COB12_09000 [Flavobacterium sp.]